MIRNKKLLVFEWNKGNIGKNNKHGVTDRECEESFFDKSKKIMSDTLHSEKEERFILLGKTREKRLLFIVFTILNTGVRIISARDINRKEVKLYEKTA